MSSDTALMESAPFSQPEPKHLAAEGSARTSANQPWESYRDLQLEAVVYLPLQRISLLDLSRVVAGTIFRSAFHVTHDLYLRVDDTFMASVSLEPAGNNRGIRINSFDARAQFFPDTAATNLAPHPSFELNPEALNLLHCTVPLSLCFGSRSVLLKDALQLAPGQLFNMNSPLLDPVSLRAHNRIVAYGTPMLHSNFYSILVTDLATPSLPAAADRNEVL